MGEGVNYTLVMMFTYFMIQRQATKDAGTIAGYVLPIITTHSRCKHERNALIYDLGRCTFGMSYRPLKMEPLRWKPLQTTCTLERGLGKLADCRMHSSARIAARTWQATSDRGPNMPSTLMKQ